MIDPISEGNGTSGDGGEEEDVDERDAEATLLWQRRVCDVRVDANKQQLKAASEPFARHSNERVPRREVELDDNHHDDAVNEAAHDRRNQRKLASSFVAVVA